MAIRKSQVAARFEGDCPNCDGTGLWMQRAGHPCRRCLASGKITVAVVNTRVSHNGIQHVSYHIVNPSGSISKERYEVPATLLVRNVTDIIAHTIGSGLNGTKVGECIREVGHGLGIYGVCDYDGEARYAVSFRDGGYTALPASEIELSVPLPDAALIAEGVTV